MPIGRSLTWGGAAAGTTAPLDRRHPFVVLGAVAGMPRRDVVAGTDVYRTRVAGETPAAPAVYVVESFAQLSRVAEDRRRTRGALSPATIALAARALGKHCVVTILGADHPAISPVRRKPAGRLRRALARFATFIALSSEVATELRRRRARHARRGHRQRRRPHRILGTRRRGSPSLGRARARSEPLLRHLRRPPTSREERRHARAGVGRPTGIDLLIVGDGQERARLERLACDLRVGTRIRFVGSTPHVAKYLKVADAFFLPSLGEGMPNALLEAMACGLPCVASSSVGGVDELLGDDRGLTVPVGDVPAWSEVMQLLTSDPQLRHTLGEAASRYVRARHSIDATADQLVDLYRELVTRR